MIEIMLLGLAVCTMIFCIILWLEPHHDWDEDVDL